MSTELGAQVGRVSAVLPFPFAPPMSSTSLAPLFRLLEQGLSFLNLMAQLSLISNLATRPNVAGVARPTDHSTHPAVVMGVPGLPVTGIVGITVIITVQPAVKNPQGTKNRSVKSLLGRNRHAMANHFAAKNQPIQKVNALFGLIVTKDQVVMAGNHARISPHVMNAHPK
jgi:hypothetical protein